MVTAPALGGDGGVVGRVAGACWRPRVRPALSAPVGLLPVVGLHHVITVREGSLFLLIPWRYRFPFALRTIIRGWFGRTPVVRRVVPERSGPSLPLSAEAWDALPTLATQHDQFRQSTWGDAQRRASRPEVGTTVDTPGALRYPGFFGRCCRSGNGLSEQT